MEYLYLTIAGGAFILPLSYIVLSILLMIKNFCVAYVTETKYTTPGIVLKPAIYFQGDDYCERYFDGSDIAIPLFLFTLVGLIGAIVWPISIVALVFYLALRTMRYLIRFKKSVFTVLKGKKCLKDCDQPSTLNF